MNVKKAEFNCHCLDEPGAFKAKGAEEAVDDGARALVQSIRGLGAVSPWCGAGAVVIGARALGRYIAVADYQATTLVAAGEDIDGSVRGPLTEAQWAEVVEHIRFGYDQAVAEHKAARLKMKKRKT